MAGMQQQIDGDNEVVIADSARHRAAGLVIKGRGNRVEIGEHADIRGLAMKIEGSGHRLLIGANCKLRGQFIIKGSNHAIRIGELTTMHGSYLLCQEADIAIGRDCMFSRDIEIRTTDAHSIVDLATRRRVNRPGSVSIGDHVWLGVGVLVSKGVTIAADVVVGAMSGVFRDIAESHVVAVGAPAAVKRRGVTWHRGRKAGFSEEELFGWKREPGRERV